jgi:hypothetical protein
VRGIRIWNVLEDDPIRLSYTRPSQLHSWQTALLIGCFSLLLPLYLISVIVQSFLSFINASHFADASSYIAGLSSVILRFSFSMKRLRHSMRSVKRLFKLRLMGPPRIERRYILHIRSQVRRELTMCLCSHPMV